MAGQLDDLAVVVTEIGTVDESAETLITGLADRLAAVPAGADPNIMASLIAELRAKAAHLAACVSANTPAAPPTPPAPANMTGDPTMPPKTS